MQKKVYHNRGNSLLSTVELETADKAFGLTFLIPSTSGLASVSIPILAPLAERLAISKVEYSSWLKFVSKLLALLFIASIIVLTIVSLILG